MPAERELLAGGRGQRDRHGADRRPPVEVVRRG